MIYNHTERSIVCHEVETAFTFVARFKGLMFREQIKSTKGLLLAPCNSVHMFFMRFPIDVVFVDREYKVVAIELALKPWRVSKVYKTALYALELPAGRARDRVAVGNVLEFVVESEH